MYAVVNGGGTGARARTPGSGGLRKDRYGSACLERHAEGNRGGRTMKDNAWFVGFAPQRRPEIVVVALFEGGEHGNLAAPIVRDVIKAYFDKKVRQEPDQSARLVAGVQTRCDSAARGKTSPEARLFGSDRATEITEE